MLSHCPKCRKKIEIEREVTKINSESYYSVSLECSYCDVSLKLGTFDKSKRKSLAKILRKNWNEIYPESVLKENFWKSHVCGDCNHKITCPRYDCYDIYGDSDRQRACEDFALTRYLIDNKIRIFGEKTEDDGVGKCSGRL